MLRKILPHVSIVLCNMYIVFFLIDRVNSAMAFIDNGITKVLLLILSIISIVNSSFLIADERRKLAAKNRRRAEAARSQIPVRRTASASGAVSGRSSSRPERRDKK